MADRRRARSSSARATPASRSASACPACTTSRCGRRCASRSIRLVGVRHEQAAAYAADGYARATGRLGVALTTTGPGAANTLGAVGEAWASRSPILVIATDIPSALRRPGVYRGVLHETDRPGGDVRAGGQGGAPRLPPSGGAAAAAAIARRASRRRTRPGVPGGRRPTCSAAEVRGRPLGRRRAARRRATTTALDGAVAALDAAPSGR